MSWALPQPPVAVPSSHSAGLLGPQGSQVRLGPMLSGSTASQSVPSQRNARPIQGQIGAIFFAATPAPVKLIIELFTKSSEAQPGWEGRLPTTDTPGSAWGERYHKGC